MFYNILHSMSKNCQMLSFGSSSQFKQNGIPTDSYSFSKRVLTDLILYYQLKMFQIWNVFSKNERKTRFIKSAIINYIENKLITIYNNKKFDFFYIKDLLNLIDNQITSQDSPNGIINYVYKPIRKLSDVA